MSSLKSPKNIAGLAVVLAGCFGFVYGLTRHAEGAASMSAGFALIGLYLLFGKNPPKNVL